MKRACPEAGESALYSSSKIAFAKEEVLVCCGGGENGRKARKEKTTRW